MHYRLTSLLLFSLLITACETTGTRTGSVEIVDATNITEVASLVDSTRIRSTIETLASFGTRMTGYPGATEAADYLAEEFRAIGLENVGLEVFIRDCLPELQKIDTVRIINILGETKEEYRILVETLDMQEGVDGIEVNVSCPNVEKGGIVFGGDPILLQDLVSRLRKKTEKPLIIKLSPNVTDIVEMAKIAESEGADAISLINTVRGISVDPETRKPRLSNMIGGLSGPAIKPIALHMVWQVARHVKIPVIGIGGILSAGDAAEFLICGASAVQVGTAHFRDPCACIKIIQGLEDYLSKKRIQNVRELIGSLDLTAV